jgi:hypothetical protein
MHAFIHRDEYACIVSVSDVLCNSKKNIRVSDVLTLFTVEHTSALDHAVVGNPLAELPSTGRSNRLGGDLTVLDRKNAENLDSLLWEGPRREQCT